MKKIGLLLTSIFLIFVLTACGSESDKMSTEGDEEIPAKTSEEDEDDIEESEVEEVEEELEDSDDIWTYYDDASHEETWEGLDFKIEKVAVSDEAPGFDEDGEETVSSAVGVKFIVENTTEDKVYTTYPDQATLVTSTGEQIDADMLLSDDVGGEIHEGVIKDGGIYFYLDRGSALEIEWVKMNWDSSFEDPDGNYDNDIYKEHSVKLELK